MKKNNIYAMMLIFLVGLISIAATYNTLIYKEQGGGKLVCASGGVIDVETGGSLELAGTAITATAAELNVMDGVTADAAELNILDGATVTTAEVNYSDITALGTQEASKVVTADANVNSGVSKVTELHIGATGSEVQVTTTPAVLNTVINFPGNMAVATVDFNATGVSAMNITIDSVVYLEADAEDFPNGIWTNGASAADSATSLISAINGDTRAAVPFTAKADTSGDGVILTWDAVGTSGNVTISSSNAAATVENSVGGEAAATKQICYLTKTITTQELLAGAITIPIPFTPTGFTFSCVDASGNPVYTTDIFTIGTSPDTILITTTGATNLANTDIVYLSVWE